MVKVSLIMFCLLIIDKTPPTISGCPKDIVVMISTIVATVTWTSPVFSDNVKVTRIEVPHKGVGDAWTTGDSALLQYRAIDAAGNSAKCTFRVTVKSEYVLL